MGRWTQPQGLYLNDDGRLLVRCLDGSRVFYHRAVMEAQIKRHLRDDEHVHHINADTHAGPEHEVHHALKVEVLDLAEKALSPGAERNQQEQR